ncbi:hypothetical protein, partial [Salmonella enterica]|uniref:hypothetical protein n=1 Tax=Salmonella enterica TaxID=28901 RepID=UPI0019D557CF
RPAHVGLIIEARDDDRNPRLILHDSYPPAPRAYRSSLLASPPNRLNRRMAQANAGSAKRARYTQT